MGGGPRPSRWAVAGLQGLWVLFLRLCSWGAEMLSLEQPPCFLGVEPQELSLLPRSLCTPCFFSGLIPHLLGDVVFLWGCNLLAHFINAYLVDDSVSDTPGGLGNDQNPGSQVGWNKDLSFFTSMYSRCPGSETGSRTLEFSRPEGARGP